MPKTKAVFIAVTISLLAFITVFIFRSLPDVPFTAAGKDQNNNSATGATTEDPQTLRLAAEKLSANELGLVPVLIYHQIGEKEGRWVRTPDNFRKDLQVLYDRNYVLVPLNDYLNGNMHVPAGKSPAVITFDDSTAGHFRLLDKNGETMVDPESAVGILRDFDEKHPGFGHVATFFVNAQPFGQPDLWQKKLQMLVEWGFEIGNHTYGHKNMSGLSSEQVADEIVKLQEHIQQAVPDYQPKTLAIVQDGLPETYKTVLSGEIRGIPYQHDGVVLWAWSAAKSPFHKEFDPKRVQRIQVFQDNGTSSLINWLDRISAQKYVSDGKVQTVAIPEIWQDVLAENIDKELVTYQLGQPERTPDKEKQASEARGVHVTFMYASAQERWDNILELVDKKQLNTVQLDVKDESGRIGYLSEVKMAQETGAGRDMLPIRDMLKELKDRHVYSVARIVIFRDPYLAQKKPEYMVRDQKGIPLSGGVWVNPYAKDVWDYNIELAREAYELGFDEVQYDYIRFPEGLAARTANYKGADGRHRVDVIADFLSNAREQLGWDKILSATVFGFTGYASDDLGIGQRPERMAPFIDYLSPMVYPSHYSNGNYGFTNPNAHPYEVVDGSLKDFQRIIESTGCQIRPWLQYFNMGSPAYGRNEIRAQIKATEDNGINSWLLWNPAVVYKSENIMP